MACLDTCFLIDLLGGGGKARRDRAFTKLRELVEAGDVLCTTRFSFSELYIGVYRSHDPLAEADKVHALLDVMEVLEFDEAAGIIFGQITAHLQSAGCPAGDMDVLIAAVAISNNHMLITDNPAHFRNIPGLEISGY